MLRVSPLNCSKWVLLIDDNDAIHNNIRFSQCLPLQHITYHIYAGSSRQKNEAVLICENESHGGCFQTRTEMYRINLEVPPIPPTDDTTSNICKVRYYVRVSAMMRWASMCARGINFTEKMCFFSSFFFRYMVRLHVVTVTQQLKCPLLSDQFPFSMPAKHRSQPHLIILCRHTIQS